MKRHSILVLLISLIVSLASAATEKWQFYPVDDAIEIVLENDIQGVFMDKSKGYDIPLIGRLGDYSYSTTIDVGSKVRILARSTAGNPSYIVETGDGQRYITGYEIREADEAMKKTFVAPNYIHYASDDIIGLSIDDVKKLWGDYMMCKKAEGENDGNPIYFYPQIQYVFDNYTTFGTKLYADENGMIKSIESKLPAHHNLFGKLPFYKDILNLNLQEYVRKPLWRDEAEFSNSDPGFFTALLFGLIWLALVVAAVTAVIFAINYIVKYFRPKGSNIPLFIIYSIILVLALYPSVIYILQYYHNAWWVLVLFVPASFVFPWNIIGTVLAQCPECHSSNLSSETINDTNRPVKTIYPTITPKRAANGGIYFDISRFKKVEQPVVIVTKCNDCGHRSTSKSMKEESCWVNNCPGCGRAIDSSFWSVPYEIYGGELRFRYIENCPECSFHYETDMLTAPVPAMPVSGGRSGGSSSGSRPVPNRYRLDSSDPHNRRTCKNCRRFDSQYCNAYGLVGDGYRVPANRIDEPWRTTCDHWYS